MINSRLRKLLSSLIYWLSYPVAFVYLRFGLRTRVLVIVGDEILVVKGLFGLDEWSLPGGGVHKGEDPLAGAVREVAEETGLQLRQSDLHFLYDAEARTHGLRFKLRCFHVLLDAKPAIKQHSREIAETAWLPLKNITLQNASKNTYTAVQAWLHH